MGAAYKITPELRAEMQADRDAGMSVAQVATKYGVSYVSVEKHTIHRKGGYAAPVSAAKNPITQEELSEKAYNYQLEESPYTVLCADYRQSGIGSNSCGPQLAEKYQLKENEFCFRIWIIPEGK